MPQRVGRLTAIKPLHKLSHRPGHRKGLNTSKACLWKIKKLVRNSFTGSPGKTSFWKLLSHQKTGVVIKSHNSKAAKAGQAVHDSTSLQIRTPWDRPKDLLINGKKIPMFFSTVVVKNTRNSSQSFKNLIDRENPHGPRSERLEQGTVLAVLEHPYHWPQRGRPCGYLKTQKNRTQQANNQKI